jgi:hypothetical protein
VTWRNWSYFQGPSPHGLRNKAEFKLLLVWGRAEVSPLSCKTGFGLGCSWHFGDLRVLERDDLPPVLFPYDNQRWAGFYFARFSANGGAADTVVAGARAEALMAEVVALRAILLNVLFKQSNGERLTAEEMQRLVERADSDKLRKARERLLQAQESERQRKEKS